MSSLTKLLLNTLAVLVAAYVVPGVQISGFFAALVVAIVLSLLNTFVKPILVLLTLPITILTLGLFVLVINTLIVFFASSLVPGFAVSSFLSALLFSLVLSLVSSVLYSFDAT